MKTRAMSGGGRWRLAMASLRIAALGALLTTAGCGVWEVANLVRHGPAKISAVAKSEPLKDVLLVTDGVLDHAWLDAVLALPKGVSLMELDLLKLKERVLATGQVSATTLTRKFPDTLAITLAERSPVARLKAGFADGSLHELLVARDGVVFKGEGFNPTMIETLPWLEGLTLTRRNGFFLPIAGMETVAELLAKAKLEAEERYYSWEFISLARLARDGEIEVRMQSGTKIIFGTREDYFRQLARLDLLLDTAAKAQPDRLLGEINLALGPQVPVTFASVADPRDERMGGSLSRLKPASPISPALPHVQIKLKREL